MIVSHSTGKLSVVIAVPVFNKDGGLKAVLAGTMSLEKVNEVLKKVKFKETGYAFLADDSGMILAHPKRPDLAGKLNVAGIGEKRWRARRLYLCGWCDAYGRIPAD